MRNDIFFLLHSQRCISTTFYLTSHTICSINKPSYLYSQINLNINRMRRIRNCILRLSSLLPEHKIPISRNNYSLSQPYRGRYTSDSNWIYRSSRSLKYFVHMRYTTGPSNSILPSYCRDN